MPLASQPVSDAAPDWLGACRRAVEGLRAMLAEQSTTAQRVRVTGTVGEGGDDTLMIDFHAEDIVFAELDRLHAEGHRFAAVSEERGEVDYGDPGVLVVIDPIDGSMNAKRGVPHHALSVAVAHGTTMGDVVFGFVHDFGPEEEWVAFRDGGAWLNGTRIEAAGQERRTDEGRLEMLGIESADPRWVAEAAEGLRDASHRLRAVGAIAVTLCQVAAARFDAMLSLKRCRAVDAAVAQLVVRESGGHVGFPGFDPPLSHPLDLVPHSPVVAARSAEGLAQVTAILR